MAAGRPFAESRPTGRAAAAWQLTPGVAFYTLAFVVPLGLLIAYSFFTADQLIFEFQYTPLSHSIEQVLVACQYRALDWAD